MKYSDTMDKKNFYTIDLDAETGKCLKLCLITKVQNSSALKKMLLDGELQCCIIKAQLIYDFFQVAVAANKAVTNEKFSKLITKSIYTEILYNLSVSKNISQSLINFGMAENDSEYVVGFIHEKNEENLQIKAVLDVIDGQLEPIENLSNIRNIVKIKKLYKIDDSELKVSRMLDSITSRISVKDFISMK